MITTSCNQPLDINKENEKLKQVDIEFSNYSIEHGMRAAFLAYLHEDGVMLRDNSKPIVGFENVANLFSGDYSQSQLSWESLFVKISKSGELGYTYGTYDFWNKTTRT